MPVRQIARFAGDLAGSEFAATPRLVERSRTPDLARVTLQLLALGALIGACFWIVRPFLVATIWASAIAVATWPLLLGMQGLLGGRRALAVTAMTLVLLIVLVVPLYLGISMVVDHARQIAEW